MDKANHSTPRGQVFTADFIVAVAVLVIGLGMLLQTVELSQREAASARISSLSDPLAQMIVDNASFIAPKYCISPKENCGDLAVFNCTENGGNVFVTRRLVDDPAICNGSFNWNLCGFSQYCEMSVYTCE